MRCIIEPSNNSGIEYVSETAPDQQSTWLRRLFIRDCYSCTFLRDGLHYLTNRQDDPYNDDPTDIQKPNCLIRKCDYSQIFCEYELVTHSLYYLRFRLYYEGANSSWQCAEKRNPDNVVWAIRYHGFWEFGL